MDIKPLQQIVLRPMTIEDVEQVCAIDRLSFSLPWSERSYRFEILENSHACNWIAEIEVDDCRIVVGMIVIWVILDEAHVATIATHPNYRQRGIARRLLAKGLLAAYQRGARQAYLEVRRSNLTAQTLYQAFGFDLVGERLKYYKDNNEDALLMTLSRLQPGELERLAG